jgi:anthranilate synthase component 1
LKGGELGALFNDWFRGSIVFSCNAGVLTIQQADGSLRQQDCADPFQYIRDFQSQFKVPTQAELPELPSFTGGLVGYLGYDAVRYIEPKLKNVPTADPVTLPDLWLMLSQTVIVFDNLKDTLFLIHHADSSQPDAYKKAQQKWINLSSCSLRLSAYKRNLILRHILNPLRVKKSFRNR